MTDRDLLNRIVEALDAREATLKGLRIARGNVAVGMATDARLMADAALVRAIRAAQPPGGVAPRANVGWCPQCGPLEKVDEDGCCPACGSLATGDGADLALASMAPKALPTSLYVAQFVQGLMKQD